MRSASSTSGSAALAQRAPDGRGGELGRRIASAVVLAPLAIAAVYFGGTALAVFMIAVAGALGWEWSRLCGFGLPHALGAILMAVLVLAVLGVETTGAHGTIAAGLSLLAVAALLFAAIRTGDGARWRWFGLGLGCLGVACVALLWLRAEGAGYVFWLFCVTWAADIGAYFTGRTLGGPRLAPAISPNKTWSGFAGGMLAAGLCGALFARLLGAEMVVGAGVAAVVTALAAVVGDLAESAMKRRFGVKDSSNLIPGHGGVLDRLDSLLLAAPVTAALLATGWRWL